MEADDNEPFQIWLARNMYLVANIIRRIKTISFGDVNGLSRLTS